MPFALFRSRPTRWTALVNLCAGLCGAATALAANNPAPLSHKSNAHPLPGYEIIPLGRGHYNRLTLAATINGVKGLFYVDTGASLCLLNATKYSFLRQNAAERPANIPSVVHPNGLAAPVCMATDVQIGAVKIAKMAFPTLPQRYFYDAAMLYADNSSRQYDGLLGESILRHFNAVVDCGHLGLYLNLDPSRKLDLSNALTHHGWTQIPMTNFGANFTVPCTFGNKPFRIIVDTGSPFTVFDSAQVSGAQVQQSDIPMRGHVLGYTSRQMSRVLTDSLRIGSYLATEVHLSSRPELSSAFKTPSSDTGPPVIGLLGGDILAKNAAMIDIGNHNLYLKPPTATP